MIPGTQCKVCGSGYRQEIENMMVTEGKKYPVICAYMEEKGISLSPANLSTHKSNHMLTNVDSLIALSKGRASLMPAKNIEDLSPIDKLKFVAQQAAVGIAALQVLPTSHYTLNALNGFLTQIRQIAEIEMKASGNTDKEDITEMINKQLKDRGLMIDITNKE